MEASDVDLTNYRWWTFAKDENEARRLIKRTRETNALIGCDPDHGLGASAVIDRSITLK